MKFKMIDGKEIGGRSYDDVVAAMAGAKLREPRSLESYRRATARRIKGIYRSAVNTKDNRSFIQSLEQAGLLERIEA